MKEIALQTKEDYRRLLLDLLNPLLGKISPGRARVLLDGAGATYPSDVIELEGFARLLWGLVPFWYGGGSSPEFEEVFRLGIEAGTSPDNPEFWGYSSDYDQRFVEMAPFAFGILAVPQKLWEPLSEGAKNSFSSWLEDINHHELSKCNWYFFRIMVNLALKSVGKPYSEALLSSDLAFIESNYRGNGWFVDGVSGRFDYYSAFAMQYYSILCSVFARDERTVVDARERALMFSRDFKLYFANSGEAICYGRSQIYRFAQVAFWSALALIDDRSDWGIIKGLVNRNLGYFLGKDIFTSEGILNVGYCYPNLTIAEKYNAPGSPYWSLKVFVLLALPDDHPYWKAEEQPLDVDDGNYLLKEPNFLLQRLDGDCSLYTVGMLGMRSLGHFTDKYDKFLYSSLSPFSVARTSESIPECAPDNMLAFVIDGYVYVRRGSIQSQISKDSIVSVWSVPGVQVTTTIVLTESGHVRKHVITSEVDCVAYDCGSSVERNVGLSTHQEEGYLLLESNFVQSAVRGCGKPQRIDADPNANYAWRNSSFPAMVHAIGKGTIVIEDEFILKRRK